MLPLHVNELVVYRFLSRHHFKAKASAQDASAQAAAALLSLAPLGAAWQVLNLFQSFLAFSSLRPPHLKGATPLQNRFLVVAGLLFNLSQS